MKQLGPYRLLQQLAVGGMAEIYIAKAAGVGGFEKLVALKVIHPNYSSDPEFVQMLVDEAKLSVQLQHANIVQTFDLGRVDEQYYIAMELIEGVDLYKLLRTASEKDIEFPFEVAAYIAMETANGLDYAHRKRDSKGRPLQIVHRDVSPQNILVSTDGEVKIVDFGIAKAALRGQKTAAGVIKGKYYYMSPEQAWGDPIDARTDVFSTGILLYEMTVGQMLYLEEDMDTLLKRVRAADIPPPSMLRGNLPEELEQIAMTALKKPLAERYQSAQELGQALQGWLRTNAPDFHRTRLGTFMKDVLGPQLAAPPPPDQTVTRDPRIATAHTREMLERDQNSLLFKLSDLKPPEPAARPRSADQPTSPVSLPEVGRLMQPSHPPSDFEEESDQTVVDMGNTLLANLDATSAPAPPPDDESLFDDEDEETLSTGEPVKRELPTLKAQKVVAPSPSPSMDPSEPSLPPLPGVRPLDDRPTVARPRALAKAQPLLDEEPDEATAQHKKPKARPRPPSAPVPVPVPLPVPDSSESVTLQRQRRNTSPEKLAASSAQRPALLPDDIPTPAPSLGTIPRPTPAWPPAASPSPSPSRSASSTQDEPTRIPPPLPPGSSGLFDDVPGLPVVAPHELPSGSQEIHGTELVPKTGSLRTMVVVLVIAALALGAVVLALSFGGRTMTKAAVEVVSSPPGAEVYLDGAALGRATPLRIEDVDVHSAHHVRVSLKGYDVWESDVRFTDTPALSPVTRLQAVLVPTVGTLTLGSVPPGAEAIVNGRIRGLTPVTVGDLPPNDEVTIELRLRGYKAVRTNRTFQGSRKLDVQIPLEKVK